MLLLTTTTATAADASTANPVTISAPVSDTSFLLMSLLTPTIADADSAIDPNSGA